MHIKDFRRLVLGTLNNAIRIKYQQHYRCVVPVHSSLETTCEHALRKISKNIHRTVQSETERSIPLHVWQMNAFPKWYEKLKSQHDGLTNAYVTCEHHAGAEREGVYSWKMNVTVHLSGKDMQKESETNADTVGTVSLLLYERAERLEESRVIVVQVPQKLEGCSIFACALPSIPLYSDNLTPKEVAEICHREVGLLLAPDRFLSHASKQAASVVPAQMLQLVSVKLTRYEMNAAVNVALSTGKMLPRVLTYREIMEDTSIFLDWQTVGMIVSVVR